LPPARTRRVPRRSSPRRSLPGRVTPFGRPRQVSSPGFLCGDGPANVECFGQRSWPASLACVGSVLEQSVSALFARPVLRCGAPACFGTRAHVPRGRSTTAPAATVRPYRDRPSQGFRRSFTASCQISPLTRHFVSATVGVVPAGGVAAGFFAPGLKGWPTSPFLCVRCSVPKIVSIKATGLQH
jgi:hypothetical protein